MQLLPSNNKKLRETCEPFNFETGIAEVHPHDKDFDDVNLSTSKILTATELYELLRDTMCKQRGLGLSACQLGIMTRVFVIGNPDTPDQVLPVFNPKIVDMSTEMEIYEEGCLSFPGLFVKVKRPASIRVRYTDHLQNTDTLQFSGLTARVFQHEYDHLDGIVFTKRADPFHLEQAKRQMKKLNRLRKHNENKLLKAG